MRAGLGFAAVHVVFAAAGMALLYALGLVSRLRALTWALGPAYFCGLAAVMPVLILLLVLGVPVRLPLFAAVSLALTAAFGAAGLAAARRGREPLPVPAPAPTRIEAAGALAAIAALALFFGVGTTSFENLATLGDDWAIWSYKGLALFEFGVLQPEIFEGTDPGPSQPGHPVLQPLLQSLFFRAMSGPHLQEFHAALWIVFASFVWTVAFLLRSRGAGLPLLAPLAALALTPGSQQFVAIGYADVTVAGFTAAGALAIGLWLDDGDSRYALLGSILLAAAANSKSEGLVAAALVLVAAAAAIAFARLREWRSWFAAVGIASAGAAPWVAWRARHGIENADVRPLTEALDWSLLSDRTDRLSRAIGELFEQLSNQGRWVWIVPCFLVLGIVCLANGTARRQAGFYLGTATLMMLVLFWVYWTTRRQDFDTYLHFSADRVVTGVVFVSGVGLMHLIALAAPWQRPARSADPPPEQTAKPPGRAAV
jgi:hypothetical protein